MPDRHPIYRNYREWGYGPLSAYLLARSRRQLVWYFLGVVIVCWLLVLVGLDYLPMIIDWVLHD